MWKNLAFKIHKDDEGQGLVEYVLIVSLVSILLAGGLQAFQGGISGMLASVVAIL